ncbi:Acetyltransferases including N-acetylases of ribosomal proteins-like protein [Shewanella denitrificans OS217]|jgi:N-acetyltransferase|uniref:Acetyltransferases including N-acetylases of ribosomal proteins-like protein n=1 Tax=Shewanella denitrificans (strain OS217 / ATCC BAA-1090 / DSM 15013) TaxID=318161 RepID=Q12Q16_SHEDO|nr:GNAT family protein [Shewanella denitrificans]ABE54460.1 Acetyltransferases including N-acetylases of ribosomal proteins-like protein [Shewanella denitrificans OS217]
MLDLTPHQLIDGQKVQLELLCDRHIEGLKIAVANEKLWQKTFVNTESKLLLLQLAFKHVNASRVEFLTDLNNQNSQRAIERIGGVKAGLIRQHMILRKGRKRDSVIYSILNHEWTSVKDNLNSLFAAYSLP